MWLRAVLLQKYCHSRPLPLLRLSNNLALEAEKHVFQLFISALGRVALGRILSASRYLIVTAAVLHNRCHGSGEFPPLRNAMSRVLSAKHNDCHSSGIFSLHCFFSAHSLATSMELHGSIQHLPWRLIGWMVPSSFSMTAIWTSLTFIPTFTIPSLEI